MPDFRQNILTGDWVIIAEDRAGRPGAFAAQQAIDDDRDCPFCVGNEHTTPSETFALRDTNTAANTPGWQVRFVPNRYPAISPLLENLAPHPWPDALHPSFPSFPAIGIHEVIIESPRHIQSPVELSVDEFRTVVRAYRDRMRELAAREDVDCMILFKNSGAGAGASIAHIHSQLVALPNAPPAIADRAARCHAHFEQHARSLIDDWLAEELSSGERIVSQADGFVALCPWASRFPVETWLVPKSGPAHFEQLTAGAIDEFAALLHDTLKRVETVTSSGPYNLFLHNPPCSEPVDSPARWHVAILPRLANPGGFEWSTGIHINPVSPERAAESLRENSSLM